MLDFMELFHLDDGEGTEDILMPGMEAGDVFPMPDVEAGEDFLPSDVEAGEDFLMPDVEVGEDGPAPGMDMDGMFLDSDGDGIPDIFATGEAMDTNGDGVPDLFQADMETDVDGDGIADIHSVITGIDLDGDGEIDLMEVAEDFDNDGLFDSVGQYADLDGDGIWDSLGGDAFDQDVSAPAYEQFDPYNAQMEHIVGNPAEEMENWHLQETDSSCAVASQEFVLEQLTDREYEESELRELAEEQGWYDPCGGTAMADMGNILEYMGLNVDKSVGNTMEDLESCIENGSQVIVSVDGLELWLGEDNDLFGPGLDANHAVQVIGIDRSDAGNPMVILNDSGVDNGGGAMIPMDVFLGAWEDSGCFMVEAYA